MSAGAPSRFVADVDAALFPGRGRARRLSRRAMPGHRSRGCGGTRENRAGTEVRAGGLRAVVAASSLAYPRHNKTPRHGFARSESPIRIADAVIRILPANPDPDRPMSPISGIRSESPIPLVIPISRSCNLHLPIPLTLNDVP
jgi:hypothetical protein